MSSSPRSLGCLLAPPPPPPPPPPHTHPPHHHRTLLPTKDVAAKTACHEGVSPYDFSPLYSAGCRQDDGEPYAARGPAHHWLLTWSTRTARALFPDCEMSYREKIPAEPPLGTLGVTFWEVGVGVGALGRCCHADVARMRRRDRCHAHITSDAHLNCRPQGRVPLKHR